MNSQLKWLTSRPIAHRGLHNSDNKIYENTLSACRDAIAGGYNIEVDLQLACDNKPVIFHDFTLERMAGEERNVRELNTTQLRQMHIGEGGDHVASLQELLELTKGKVGLVLELKGLAGKDDGFVESVAECLKTYDGPVALMSFNHWLLHDIRKIAPDFPLGLVAQGDDEQYQSHKMIADGCQIDFVSYDFRDLPCKFTSDFRKQFQTAAKPLICWTIKSAQEMAIAYQHSDQITFEGFKPDIL